MTKSEHDIQNEVRIAISENSLGVCFRANVGVAWVGNKIIKQKDGSILIKEPRPFKTGLPEGFSDLLIIQSLVVTPEMVGQQVAQASFLEIKKLTGKPSSAQLNFIEQMQRLGAKAGVARSVEDALSILEI
ncbi:VRR-NUC domain-containing protein [Pelosinus baikalensis]|uniref:VRR-NUC domain-containing protein n=1 Tax=Pelosinus baikalensis TaxID=2892015 RepID=A0ABS8HT52_9FIRM|nr:VRR-NUC domain-containing protein [Pelosinus baikalensis]MCC5466122.1 VRR-NUC domain-containing protein [Pelosinus baikalensis]